ncbi:MAG: hypothetical protein J2P21_02830 [Chloracidobacterium sp.]|nr:hypothetical protein [Chloracidobacterium sp.]
MQSLDSSIVCAIGAFADIIGAPLEQIIGRACAEVFGCSNESGRHPPILRLAGIQGAVGILLQRRNPNALNVNCSRACGARSGGLTQSSGPCSIARNRQFSTFSLLP